MTDDEDDYELSVPTAEMLKIWRHGSDEMKKTPDHGGGREQIEALHAYIDTLDKRETGLVVIDLLTLVDAMEQAVTEMNLRGIAGVS